MKLAFKYMLFCLAVSRPGWCDPSRWTSSGDGMLTDATTGLQWTQSESPSDVDWESAKLYCSSLNMSKTGWRLPDIQELEAIRGRSPDESARCGGSSCQISPQFSLSSVFAWSKTLTALDKDYGKPRALAMDFEAGMRADYSVSFSLGMRAICVRASANTKRWSIAAIGVLNDSTTRLQWTQMDNRFDIDWIGAKRYCNFLDLDGGKWRIPTSNELSGISTKGSGAAQCGAYMCTDSPLFGLTSFAFWAAAGGDHSESEVFKVALNNGLKLKVPIDNSTSYSSMRALCVRLPIQ